MTALLTILAACIGVLVSFAAIIAVSSVINGYVLSVLWGWFVVPTFGAPVLSIPVAIGLSLVVAYMTFHYDMDKAKDPDHKWWLPLVSMVLRPVIALGFGAIVHAFV